MNYSTAVMLINTNIRAIHVIYDADTETVKAKRHTFKTLDQSLKAGDLVIVPTDKDHRHGFTVSKVDDVDVDVDFDSNVQVKWIAGVFAPARFDQLLVEEDQYINLIKKGEQLKRRKDIAANVDALKIEELQSLPIAHYGSSAQQAAITDETIAGGDTLKA